MHDSIHEWPITQEILRWGQQLALQMVSQERCERLESLRRTVLIFTQARFHRLTILARKQVTEIADPGILEDLIARIGLAQTEEEALYALIWWRRETGGSR